MYAGNAHRQRTPGGGAADRPHKPPGIPGGACARSQHRSRAGAPAPDLHCINYDRTRRNDDTSRQDAPSARRSRRAACHPPTGHAARRTESALHRAIGQRSTFKRWQLAFCNIATRILPVEHWTRYAIHRRSEARNKHSAGAIPGAADRRTVASRSRSAGGIQRREHNRLYPGIDRKPGSIRRRLYPFIVFRLYVERNALKLAFSVFVMLWIIFLIISRHGKTPFI